MKKKNAFDLKVVTSTLLCLIIILCFSVLNSNNILNCPTFFGILNAKLMKFTF